MNRRTFKTWNTSKEKHMAYISTRRDFLRQTTVAALGALAAPAAFAADQGKSDDKIPYKISLAEWSLHRTIREGKLDPLDFAPFTKKEFGIEAIEYVNQFFMDKAKDKAYLGQLKAKAEDAGVKSLLIMIDREGDLGAADEAARAKAIENHYKWVEAAKFLGCHSIRVNARSTGSYEDQLERAADGLRRLSQFAKDHDQNVIVENHGGLSSNGQWLAAVIKKVDLPNCGTLPDFGNFRLGDGQVYDRYKGVEELMPYAKAVSAKSYDFNAEGDETTIDYFRMMKIVTDAGYHGYVGIEYEGGRLSEVDGIKATNKLLQRVREKLS